MPGHLTGPSVCVTPPYTGVSVCSITASPFEHGIIIARAPASETRRTVLDHVNGRRLSLLVFDGSAAGSPPVGGDRVGLRPLAQHFRETDVGSPTAKQGFTGARRAGLLRGGVAPCCLVHCGFRSATARRAVFRRRWNAARRPRRVRIHPSRARRYARWEKIADRSVNRFPATETTRSPSPDRFAYQRSRTDSSS